MQTSKKITVLSCLFAVTLAACQSDKSKEATPADTSKAADPAELVAGIETGKGVDLASKTIRLGALNDESGPAATIGKPYAVGKRVMVAQANAQGLLPDGWKLELVEKDHGYNPQKAVQAYNEIKDDVLMIATSFGTPNTLPLRPMLERDKIVALPASLSSQMAAHRYTVPAGPAYELEAMRAMDWVVEAQEQAGAPKDAIKAAIVYQQDDYGEDGLSGWKKAAAHHGVKVVSEQTVTPGQRDFAAIVSSLKKAGATHVLLTILPSASGPLLGTSAQLQYTPTWVGQTPSWIDGFFNPEVIPSAVFAKFHWVTSVPFWGEDLPGMDGFIKAYEAYGKAQNPPDFYLLTSYLQGLYAAEIIKRALAEGDLTREGLMKAVQSVESFDGNGLVQPISTKDFPYVTGTATRVMRPDFEKKRWSVVSDFAAPRMLGGAAEPVPEAAEAEAAAADKPEGAQAPATQ